MRKINTSGNNNEGNKIQAETITMKNNNKENNNKGNKNKQKQRGKIKISTQMKNDLELKRLLKNEFSFGCRLFRFNE